jgi:hypothetical protein
VQALTLLYGRAFIDTVYKRIGKHEHLRGRGQIVAYVRDNNGCLVELCTPVG